MKSLFALALTLATIIFVDDLRAGELDGLYVQDGNQDYWYLYQEGGKVEGMASWGSFEMEPGKKDFYEVKGWADSKFRFEKASGGAVAGFTEIKAGKEFKHFARTDVPSDKSISVSAVEGTWKGTTEKNKVDLFLKAARNDQGILGAEISAPAQGILNRKVDKVLFKDGLYLFQVDGIGYFLGTVHGPRKIEGRWFQSGAAAPLVFNKIDKAPEFKGISKKGQFTTLAEQYIKPAIRSEWMVGAAVGFSNGKFKETAGFGNRVDGRKGKPDQDTEFEIGSISKVFTHLLALDMARRGEIALDKPIQSYLPGTKLPKSGGAQITMRHLLDHTSGLPRDPTSVDFKDDDGVYQPFLKVDAQDVVSGLSKAKLLSKPGLNFSYSNWGYELASHILTKVSKKSYEQLLQERICGPLGMKDTSTTWNEDQLKRAAQGHTAHGEARPLWTWKDPTLVGVGGIHSTVRDMLIFGDSLSSGKVSELTQAAVDLAGSSGRLAHAGQTYGFNANFEVIIKDGITDVMLSNSASIGAAVLSGALANSARLGTPVKSPLPIQVELKLAQLKVYAGTYQVPVDYNEKMGTDPTLKKNTEIEWIVKDGKLTAATGGLVLCPASADEFFDRQMDTYKARKDEKGMVEGVDINIPALGYSGFFKKIK